MGQNSMLNHSFPVIKRPINENVLERLEKRLLELIHLKNRTIQNPRLAMAIYPSYRELIYKIKILTHILLQTDDEDFSFVKEVEKLTSQHEENFDIHDYFGAYLEIVSQLGIELPINNKSRRAKKSRKIAFT